jgi:putative spermidine/putrescine transport system permease protein
VIKRTLSLTPQVWRIGAMALSVLVFVFLIAPILIIVPLSFSADPFFSYPIEHWSLRWYAALVADDPQALLWQRAVVNSLIIGFSATLIATCLGTLAAIGVWRSPRPLANTVTALMLSPIVVPIVVTAIGTYYFYARLGLVGTYAGLILAHAALGAPFVFVTVTATLASFDETLLKAGASLGASPARVFRMIMLPLILPGVVSGAIFAFATSWDEVVIALFLAGPEQHTIPRRMWSGVRDNLSPTIIAAATLLIALSLALMLTLEWLRRRSARLRLAQPVSIHLP